jgi:ParB family chromosome partitioning protein
VIKKRGLGRGLDALLGSGDRTQNEESTIASGTNLAEIPIDQIHPGQYQPRRNIRDEGIAELAASIRAQGVMQPIVLRHRAIGGYEIIAGERRWRASQLAGLDRIPAVIKEVSDERAVAMALIENIQREDLNPLEEALALQRLSEEFHLTQQQVADAVGKSRVAVTNLLRLLNLAAPVREMLAEGELEMGHARALLSLSALEQEQAARQVIARGLSVRQTEALVRQRMRPAALTPLAAVRRKDPDTARLELELSERIGAPVSINFDGKSNGTLVIRYTSVDELEGILTHLR